MRFVASHKFTRLVDRGGAETPRERYGLTPEEIKIVEEASK